MIVLFILIGLLVILGFIIVFKKENTNEDNFLEELVATRMQLDKKRAILNLLANKKVSVYDLSICNNVREYNFAIAYGKSREETELYELEKDDFAFLKEHLFGQEVSESVYERDEKINELQGLATALTYIKEENKDDKNN